MKRALFDGIELILWFLAWQFISVLEKELDTVEKDKETFITDFSEVRLLIAISHFLFSLLSEILYRCLNECRFLCVLQEDYNDIVGGWKSKLVRSSSGEQRWGLFIAEKK